MQSAVVETVNKPMDHHGGLKESEVLDNFADILNIDIANGDARPDTIRAYKSNMKLFVEWYREQGYNINNITEWHIKKYRQYMINRELARSTMSLKLTTIRRFFEGMKDRGYIEKNPAENVKPPRDREAKETRKHLTPGEVELLIQELNNSSGIKSLRDKAMIALMLMEGWRAVEVVRANVEDIDWQEGVIFTRGKGKDGHIYPREDTLQMINDYLEAREAVKPDDSGTPLFVNLGHSTKGTRLSRPGLRKAVNSYLKAAGIKRDGISCHALRHTCGMMLYKNSKDIKVVQETLRHSDPSTAAKYSHITERKKARYTEDIPIKF